MINKLAFSLLLSFTLLSPLLMAQTPLALALESCRAEQNSSKRLLCYDQISLGSSEKVVSAVAPKPTAIVKQEAIPTTENSNETTSKSRAATITTSSSEFGLENRRELSELPDRISVVVTKISFNLYKKLIIEFDNGQIWQQTDSTTYPIKVGEQHFIRRGALGAFYLGNEKSNRRIKVRRER